MNHLKIILQILLMVLLFFAFPSCVGIGKKLDVSGLSDMKKELLSNFHPGKATELEQFIRSFTLDKYTVSDTTLTNVQIKKLNKWHLKDKHLIYEKWLLPSRFHYKTKCNNAVYYVIRKSKIENSKVILWVPGKGVSDFAFHFIKKFFLTELENGYNIIIYIPAYHLERTATGKKSSVGFFTSSILDNTKNILNSTKEISDIINFLKYKKVKSISGWAGSMGAPMLLLANGGQMEYAHCVLMIPVLDFNTVFMRKDFNDLLDKYQTFGFSRTLIKSANNLISPINYTLKTNPKKVLILYGKYDQLNPTNTIQRYAKNNHISNILMYNLSHSTILLSKKMYADYGTFLNTLQ